MPLIKFYGDRLPIGLVGSKQVVAVPASKGASPPIHADRWARNGKHPNAALINMMLEAGNQSLLYRAKEVFRGVGPIGAAGILASSGLGDRARWRFAFRTGLYSHALMAIVVLAPQSAGTAENAYARLDIRDSANALIASQTFVHGASPQGSTVAAGWQYLKVLQKYVDGLSADTDYFATFFDVDYGRIQSATVFDINSATENFSGYLPQNVTAQSSVLDVYREKLSTLLSNLWKRSGATVLNWSVNDGTAPQTRATNTDINIIDNSSTTISAATPGYTLDMTNKARVSQTTGVPCRMQAYGQMSAGSNLGSLKLKDSAGNTVATIANMWGTTASWQTTTFNLPAAVDKYDLHFHNGGSGTFSLYAVSIYEHE